MRFIWWAILVAAQDGGMEESCLPIRPLEDTIILNERVLHGRVACEHVEYLGIPYAQAPTGHRRWQPPQPMEQLPQSPFDATQFGNYCWQLYSGTHSGLYDTFFRLDPHRESEDCLNLNIYAPRQRRRQSAVQDATRLPVLVFIHGGAFSMGTNQTPLNNPSNLCIQQDLIVVSINYRLGIFGFLASPRLLPEEKGPIGNYGLLDQMEALRWIKRNIAAFGGDPERITLLGQSAGAVSVHFLTILCKNETLFHAAILLSGTVELLTPRTLKEDNFAHQSFDVLATRFGCEEARNLLACLRGIPAQELVAFGKQRQWDYIWGPTVDGRLITLEPAELNANDQGNLPRLITTCRDEGSVFAAIQIMRGDRVSEDIHRVIKDDDIRQLALDVYQQAGPSEYDHLNRMLTDGLFVCPLRRMQLRRPPSTWYLLIDRQLPLVSAVSKLASGFDIGVFHGIDIHLLFRAFPWVTLPHNDVALQLQDLIGGFCRESKPDAGLMAALGQADQREWFDDFTRKKCDTIWSRLPSPPINIDWNADLSPHLAEA